MKLREIDRPAIKPEDHRSLLELLATLEPMEEDFPDIDSDLLPPREIVL